MNKVISIDQESLIWKLTSISSTEKIVLLALRFYSKRAKEGVPPSMGEIGASCGLARQTVHRAINHLVGCGLISKQQGNPGYPSNYTINITALLTEKRNGNGGQANANR